MRNGLKKHFDKIIRKIAFTNYKLRSNFFEMLAKSIANYIKYRLFPRKLIKISNDYRKALLEVEFNISKLENKKRLFYQSESLSLEIKQLKIEKAELEEKIFDIERRTLRPFRSFFKYYILTFIVISTFFFILSFSNFTNQSLSVQIALISLIVTIIQTVR